MNSAGLQILLYLCNTRGKGPLPSSGRTSVNLGTSKGSELQQTGENQGCANMVVPLVNRYPDGAAATPAEGVLFVSTDECPPPVDIQVFWPKGVRGIREQRGH